jgi:ABC-2 type transport system permease protein
MSAIGKIWTKLVNNVKLYIFFFVLNYKELEVDSLDFLFGIAAKLLSYAAEVLSLLFIFELVPEINGWDKYQVFFVYGLNLDGFDDDSFGEFATGIVILIYSWVKLKISPWYLPVALIAAVSGCFIYAGISILLSSFSFFTVGNADVANFTMQIKDIAKYPMTIYPKVLQFVFTFIFPVAFVAFLPMRMIMGDIRVFLIMLVPLVSGAFYWFSKKIWMLSLRHYGSSGS